MVLVLEPPRGMPRQVQAETQLTERETETERMVGGMEREIVWQVGALSGSDRLRHLG